jgi:EAL domain-containing protein (putative c-di-GMP-specific phosphodiesterase class I)
MAESVGAVTVAEGVEDPFAAERLRAVGVRYVQGFAYGRPGVAADWTREAVLGVLPALAPTDTG